MDGLKELIKGTLRKIFGKDLSEIEIDEKTYIFSFDMFDTLVKRNCKRPKDVFLLVQKKSGFDSFYEKRIIAEKKARGESKEEITLKNIYEKLDGYSEDQKQYLQQLEISTEFEVCYPNSSIVEVFNRISARKIILTDMYLSYDSLVKILDKCGIHGYELMIVSGECGKTKRRGDLYDYALKCLKAKKGEFLHIGDNPISDYIIPKLMGIKSFLII